MGTITKEYRICDICNRKEEKIFNCYPEGWRTLHYKRSWSDGGHHGTTEQSYLVCSKCLEHNRPARKFLGIYNTWIGKEIK